MWVELKDYLTYKQAFGDRWLDADRLFLKPGTFGEVIPDSEGGEQVVFEFVKNVQGDLITAWVPYNPDWFIQLKATEMRGKR